MKQRYKENTFTLEVAFSDTIEAIKVKIQEKGRIPRECQQLNFAQKELKDGHILRDYNILEGTQLSLRTTEWEGKQLLYHTLHVVLTQEKILFIKERSC